MPLLLTDTVAPAIKFVPVRTTGTIDPCFPLAGLIDVSVGTPWFTVNGTDPLVPAAVVTVTLAAPTGALASMMNTAVNCVEEVTLTPLTEIPPGQKAPQMGTTLTAVPAAAKPVPVKVT